MTLSYISPLERLVVDDALRDYDQGRGYVVRWRDGIGNWIEISRPFKTRRTAAQVVAAFARAGTFAEVVDRTRRGQ